MAEVGVRHLGRDGRNDLFGVVLGIVFESNLRPDSFSRASSGPHSDADSAPSQRHRTGTVGGRRACARRQRSAQSCRQSTSPRTGCSLREREIRNISHTKKQKKQNRIGSDTKLERGSGEREREKEKSKSRLSHLLERGFQKKETYKSRLRHLLERGFHKKKWEEAEQMILGFFGGFLELHF